MPHKHDNNEEKTVLQDCQDMIRDEVRRVSNATALPSVKDAILHRVFPLISQLAEAIEDETNAIRVEVLGDDDDDEADPGAVEELEDRIDQIEEAIAIASAGFEMKSRLTALCRSVQTYCTDRPNVVAEAQSCMDFLAEAERNAVKALEEVAQATATEDGKVLPMEGPERPAQTSGL